MPTFATFIQVNFGDPSQRNQSRKSVIKSIQIVMEVVKLSLFVEDILLYIGNPTDSKKLLELIHKFS